jgi:hypothetical protein
MCRRCSARGIEDALRSRYIQFLCLRCGSFLSRADDGTSDVITSVKGVQSCLFGMSVGPVPDRRRQLARTRRRRLVGSRCGSAIAEPALNLLSAPPSHSTVPAIAHHGGSGPSTHAAIWRPSAKRESLANSRGSTRGQGSFADGLASVSNMELQDRNWSSMHACGPRRIQITGGVAQQRVSALGAWSRRTASRQHAGRQGQPRTTAGVRTGPRCITPLLAAGLLRG